MSKLAPGAARQFARHLQREQQSNERDNRYIRVSSIGFCGRRLGYGVLGYQPLPSDSHSQVTLDLGNAVHDMLQRKLVQIGWVKAEPYLNDRWEIDWRQTDDPLSGCELDVLDHETRTFGHLDGVTVPLLWVANAWGETELVPHPEGHRYVIEIKTITDKSPFWVLGIRDGGTGLWREDTEGEAEFLELDADVSKTSGTLQQRVSRVQHLRKVAGGARPAQLYPVHKVRIGGKDELVTVKMIGHSMGSFSSIQKPKDAHIAQASWYAHHFGIERILYIYLGKDVDSRLYADPEDPLNIPLRVFEHVVDPTDVYALQQRVRHVYRSTDRGDLPARDFEDPEEKGVECRWCPFRPQCWPERYPLAEVNAGRVRLGLPEVAPGPGITHEAKADLREEFASKRMI